MGKKYQFLGKWPRRPLYKYVDIDDADAVQSGSTKIGTLRGYAKLEGSRRDENENQLNRIFTQGSELITNNPADLEFIIQMFGERACIPNLIINAKQDCTINSRGPDYYCHCFALSPDIEELHTDKKQAVFALHDLPSWLNEVNQSIPYFQSCRIDKVRYGERDVHYLDGRDKSPDPFLKPTRFEHEAEYRILWNTSINFHQDLDQIPISASNSRVGRLLKRVR